LDWGLRFVHASTDGDLNSVFETLVRLRAGGLVIVEGLSREAIEAQSLVVAKVADLRPDEHARHHLGRERCRQVQRRIMRGLIRYAQRGSLLGGFLW
jgi:hypothetical protein